MKHSETARRIKEAMTDKGIIAQDLANETGINKASISHYVNGSHIPSNISAAKIGKVLNVNPLWLMGFEVGKSIPIGLQSIQAEADFLKKFHQLSDSHKKIVMDLIDSLLNS